MILSCLQGHMGQVRTGGGHPPESALCAIGDFCFFAGRPDPALVRQADWPLLVPRTGDWAPVIRAVGAAVPSPSSAMPSVGPRRTLTGTGWPPSPPPCPQASPSPPFWPGTIPADGPGLVPGPVRQFPGRSRLRPAWAGGHRSSGRGPRGRRLLLRRLGRRHRDPDRHPAGPAPPGAGPCPAAPG